MKRRKNRTDRVKARDVTLIRATISVPSDLYVTLQGIAKQKRVSLAWVVRDAAEKYVVDKWPLFAGSQRNEEG